jgi:hypothetical protein
MTSSEGQQQFQVPEEDRVLERQDELRRGEADKAATKAVNQVGLLS